MKYVEPFPEREIATAKYGIENINAARQHKETPTPLFVIIILLTINKKVITIRV